MSNGDSTERSGLLRRSVDRDSQAAILSELGALRVDVSALLGDVGGLKVSVGNLEGAKRGRLAWLRSPLTAWLSAAVVVVTLLTTDHRTVADHSAQLVRHEATLGLLGAALIPTCVNAENASLALHDTLPPPPYAQRAFALLPTCSATWGALTRTLDGAMP